MRYTKIDREREVLREEDKDSLGCIVREMNVMD